MSVHFEPALSRLRLNSERRARTTAVATLAAAQNGTYARARDLQARSSVGRLGPRSELAVGDFCPL